MKKILLSLAFLAGVSLTVSAQFKIGGKTINTKKVINAATDVAHGRYSIRRGCSQNGKRVHPMDGHS